MSATQHGVCDRQSVLSRIVLVLCIMTIAMSSRLAAQTYDSTVLASGPSGYWRFEDASSGEGATAADATGNHNGVYFGEPSLVTPPLGGTAASFNGAGQYVDVGTLGTVGSSIGSAITFELLYRSTDTSKDRIFGVFNEGGNTTVAMTSNSDHSFVTTPGSTQIYLRREGNGSLEASFDSSVVNIYDGQWHHIVWRIDDADAKGIGTTGAPADTSVYRVTIDNTPIPITYDSTFADATTFVDFNNPFRIGAAGRATPFAETVTGDIDEFAVYQKLLSDVEIESHWNALLDNQLLPGDFNGGGVDITDFMILNDNLAAHLDRTVTFEDGDFDFDGDIDLDDFSQFKAVYPGIVAAALGAVPEPSTLLLLLSLAFLLPQCRLRRE